MSDNERVKGSAVYEAVYKSLEMLARDLNGGEYKLLIEHALMPCVLGTIHRTEAATSDPLAKPEGDARAEAGQQLADDILRRIAKRYANCEVYIHADLPELTPVEAVLRCAQEEGFILTNAAGQAAGGAQPASDLTKWANGPFECPNGEKHRLSYRGFHCEECGIFVGAPKSREEILTALITEREMHNAWRKRAEEAERHAPCGPA